MIVIDGGYFCAGVIIKDSFVTETAPILAYMKGWSQKRVAGYCNHKKWKWRYMEVGV